MGKAQSLASTPAWEFEPAIPRQPSPLPLRVQTLDPYLCLPIIRAWLHAHIQARNASRRFVAEALGDVKKSGVRTVAFYTSGPSWLCPGFWVNEDQNLAGLRFGFRALTRTLVVSNFPIRYRVSCCFTRWTSIYQMAPFSVCLSVTGGLKKIR
jgi:hypothetical protein